MSNIFSQGGFLCKLSHFWQNNQKIFFLWNQVKFLSWYQRCFLSKDKKVFKYFVTFLLQFYIRILKFSFLDVYNAINVEIGVNLMVIWIFFSSKYSQFQRLNVILFFFFFYNHGLWYRQSFLFTFWVDFIYFVCLIDEYFSKVVCNRWTLYSMLIDANFYQTIVWQQTSDNKINLI